VSLSFSATDYVGHRFGVQSVEVHDTYIKLDQTIANLLVFLDEQVGKKQYTVFLTSDHGAGMPRAYLQDKGIPNGQLNERTMQKELERLIAAEGFNHNWISKLMNLNLYFSDSLKTLKNDEYLKLKVICANWLTKQEGIARVLDSERTSNSLDEREQLAIRGYHPKRSGDLILIEEANWSSYADKGSTHGSPYKYDTHVPLLFYGFGIRKAEVVKPYPVTSIVSSLSLLFGFQMNQGLLAKPIEELFGQ
jgi:predicted AlkP superfamily pyrophosphatase or phosphodiesterase